MLIRVPPDGAVALEDADEFRRFAIAAPPGAAGDGTLARALEGLARMEGESHAWVLPDALRRLAPRAGDEAWEGGFAAMLAFAAGKGWTNAEGAVRAHIEEG